MKHLGLFPIYHYGKHPWGYFLCKQIWIKFLKFEIIFVSLCDKDLASNSLSCISI